MKQIYIGNTIYGFRDITIRIQKTTGGCIILEDLKKSKETKYSGKLKIFNL